MSLLWLLHNYFSEEHKGRLLLKVIAPLVDTVFHIFWAFQGMIPTLKPISSEVLT